MFSREAIKTITSSGTIAPSSKSLIKKMVEPINFKKAAVIVEFGTGNGCVTSKILDNLDSKTRIISFEVNPTFYHSSIETLPNDPRLIIRNISALKFDLTLNELEIKTVDYFVSSLPLSLFDDDIEVLLKKVGMYLHQEGRFIQFQYSIGKYNLFRHYFSKVELDFTLFNIPPAFVYSCKGYLDMVNEKPLT